MRQGTIVDAILIAATSSTKNKEGKRDPEMHQTKTGKQWSFGMKVHTGVAGADGSPPSRLCCGNGWAGL